MKLFCFAILFVRSIIVSARVHQGDFQSSRAIQVVAASTISAAAAGDLLPFETIQSLESDLDSLNDDEAATFSFDDITAPKASPLHRQITSTGCKVFPGDPERPVEDVWDLFNDLLGGALIKTVPIAAPCYSGPYYNAERCAYVTENWTNSTLHELDPTSMMSPLYQGMTCMPTTHPNSTCTLGGYPSYAVNATKVAQIQLAVNFARSTGIRLVIKNTGHDFSGKSGGAGALSVWTHNLKAVKYIPNYADKELSYSGPAFKAGSGVVAKEIYAAAAQENLVVVGGEGTDIGVMGGFIQGGGHGPMVSTYGLGADQILSMEVVTADGRFVTASSTQNTDLFWALRGGGGSTWGVVTSVTVKAFPSTPVTVVTFSFSTSATTSKDTFWLGVRAFFEQFITYSEEGIYAYFFIFPFADTYFYMQPFWAPNKTEAETAALLKPLFDRLAELNITVTSVYSTYSTIYEGWVSSFQQEAVGTDNVIIGSRLFPRSSWEDPAAFNATFDAWSASAKGETATVLIAFNIRAPNVFGVDNAVLPAWRETVLHTMQGASWIDPANATTKIGARKLLSENQLKWKAVSPGSGAYLGESDAEEVDFQLNFYGINYPRLLAIKKAVDPWNVFWARTAVGSEVLKVQSTDPIEDENGRLCWT